MRTKPAVQYLREHGLTTSVSKLQKLRCRGPDNPRDRGPDFDRDPDTGYCDYSVESLDRYLAQRLGARQFRAPLAQPEQFKPRIIRRAVPKRVSRRRAEL
jgi:hypothetical protein